LNSHPIGGRASHVHAKENEFGTQEARKKNEFGSQEARKRMNLAVTQQWARPGFQIRKAGKYEEDEILLGRILSEGHASACPGTSNF
jgi:hypothetical protein